jgi:hypothetical protein
VKTHLFALARGSLVKQFTLLDRSCNHDCAPKAFVPAASIPLTALFAQPPVNSDLPWSGLELELNPKGAIGSALSTALFLRAHGTHKGGARRFCKADCIRFSDATYQFKTNHLSLSTFVLLFSFVRKLENTNVSSLRCGLVVFPSLCWAGGRRVRAGLGSTGARPLFGLRIWTIETWLILPVVIRLSQRLSHACLSISIIQ